MRARARRWVWGLGLSVLLLGGALTAGHPVLETFLIVQSPAVRADALVVMAGSRELRVPTALRRFQEGLAPQILLANDGVRGAWSEKHPRSGSGFKDCNLHG
ncbi:MAG: hypothetical protein ACYDAI_12835 [Trichloromonadaceae bacterium]